MSVGACSVCLRGRASCSLSVERGGRSTVVCLGFSWLWFLLGGRGAGARGLQWLLGVGSTLAAARIWSTDSITEAYG